MSVPSGLAWEKIDSTERVQITGLACVKSQTLEQMHSNVDVHDNGLHMSSLAFARNPRVAGLQPCIHRWLIRSPAIDSEPFGRVNPFTHWMIVRLIARRRYRQFSCVFLTRCRGYFSERVTGSSDWAWASASQNHYVRSRWGPHTTRPQPKESLR